MGYEHLFEKRDLALLFDWLQETGELYVDLDRPHSGGLNNSLYFVESLAQLKSIVSKEEHPEICVCIFRKKQYPIRGVIDDPLMSSVLEQLPDGQDFSILALGTKPQAACEVIGWGDSHEELRDEFIRLRGRYARLGQDPLDQPEVSFFEKPDDVFVVSSLIRPRPKVSKNRTSYEPFDKAPERYAPCVDFW